MNHSAKAEALNAKQNSRKVEDARTEERNAGQKECNALLSCLKA
jgi:hypothetical protein